MQSLQQMQSFRQVVKYIFAYIYPRLHYNIMSISILRGRKRRSMEAHVRKPYPTVAKLLREISIFFALHFWVVEDSP